MLDSSQQSYDANKRPSSITEEEEDMQLTFSSSASVTICTPLEHLGSALGAKNLEMVTCFDDP
jgi:hypothetical protein